MEFEEHVDQEEEMEGYESLMAATSSSSGRPSTKMGEDSAPRKSVSGTIKYKECQRNHAVGLGGHAVDGCGEFMAAGDEGSMDALKCAACGCHRNFHRKETPSGGHHVGALYHHATVPMPPQFSSYYRGVPPAPGYLPLTRPLAITAGSGDVDEDVSNPSTSGGGGSSSRKRFRTKFTQEQKDKMLEFSERLGWRIQKHDDADVESFCLETGVKRSVLKVWMHNNKNTIGKKP